MRILKTKYFNSWADDEDLDDESLCDAIKEMNQGLHNGDLGGKIFKKRVARQGQGKSGGYRTIVALQVKERAFFLYGFGKNERANISQKEKKAFKKLAKELLGYTEEALDKAVNNSVFFEVNCNEQE